MKTTVRPKNCCTEIIVMFQRNFTLFTDQCLGHMKGALNMVDKNLNNFCGFSLLFSTGN